MSLAAFVMVLLAGPTDPIAFARAELARKLGANASRASLAIDKSLGKECYRFVGDGQRVRISGGDATGAMYGAFELAERYRNANPPKGTATGGSAFWKTKGYGKPYLAERGLNLFLTLPWDYKKNDTDYSLEALTDPDRWWFHNEDYWTTLLDLMARSRLNWLDIHGAWDISVTNAPNLYAYFVTSKSFPKVGVPQAIKDRDLAQLNHVIEMAHARGIRVSLMAYEANLRVPQNPNPGYEASEANVYTYTKEVVEQMIRRAPKLDALGYRIGESGKSGSFFHCYGEAVKASGRDIPLITRSWITRRQNVLPLARASKDYTVEIKYNGEQWGAPYMIAGGRMANWYSYSFEDYLSDSSAVPDLPLSDQAGRGPGGGVRVAKLWPGNLISPSPSGRGGQGERVQSSSLKKSAPSTPNPSSPAEEGNLGRWPSNPYKIVWQVRANGTHRIFPFYNPEMVRSTINTMKIGTATGYTIEGLDAYYPKSPDYYLANPADKYCDWIHQRDEMYWITWGRLGYDPGVKDEVFDRMVTRRFGPEGGEIASIWKLASRSIPTVFQMHSLGPDHRNHAPELESAGGTGAWLDSEPFDSFAFRPLREHAAYRALGVDDGRYKVNVGPAFGSVPGAAESVDESLVPSSERSRWREIKNACLMATHVAEYVSYRLRAISGVDADDHDRVAGAWRQLSSSPEAQYYKPFTERLRMRTNTFHWVDQLQAIEKEPTSDPILTEDYPQWPPDDRKLTWSFKGSGVQVRVPTLDAKRAWLLYKPLPSSTFFHKALMTKQGGDLIAELPKEQAGYAIAAEIEVEKGKFRVPSALNDEQPYVVVPALPGPTPQIYSAEEAMTYLDPAVLKPDKYAAMLVAPRGMRFHNGFDKAAKRKILDPVERGMTLVVMQQDYVSGRYKMDWLPVPLKVENNPQPTVFDPGGALGLKRIETSDILWQRFVTPPPSPLPAGAERGSQWEVFGNGGVAHLKWGKGHIWMINARLMQRMTYPDCARALKALMEFCASPLTPRPPLPAVHRGEGRQRPVVLIDPGTEDAAYSTSFFPDFMNVLDIPFLTLGEVIAKEQGVASFTPIPGKVEDDDILQGNGERMVNAFLRNQVVQASKRPTPSNLSDFEKERIRRKAELMRCLGLDPMPPRTPLNARITGVIQRKGYRIEKLVFESRPRFYVTAHVYVPDSPSPDGRGGWGERVPPVAERTPSTPSPSSPGEEGKFPVIVHVNGHWAHKKDEDRIQLRAAFCALQGYIAIAVDSPGWSFEGNSLIERRAEGDHNDWFLVHGGTNATGYYVWDCIRALDYMTTRADTDMSRIGITGASGGGLATLYTFAADDRYKAAVPVVYMASMELAPDNGCLCNHVPGTCQIGDRSDVIAIQAPKPVLVMGAQNDGEFPPEATLLTVEKMKKTWALFESPPLPSQGRGGWGVSGGSKVDEGNPEGGSQPSPRAPEGPTLSLEKGEGEVVGRIFEGPHDYNQLMREQMIGFFNRWLKGEGDGSPVPQPAIEVIDPEDRQLLALDPPPTDERTMRDLSYDYLRDTPASPVDPVALSGGKPRRTDLKWKEVGAGAGRKHVTFESEPGLVTPAILVLRPGAKKGVTIYVSDGGKTTARRATPVDENVELYLDILGTGELAKLEMRYLLYLGQSVAFKAGWQLVRAAEAMRKYGPVWLDAQGPLAAEAAWWAVRLDPTAFKFVSDRDPLRTWEDALKPGMSPYLVQPRAHLMGALNPSQ